MKVVAAPDKFKGCLSAVVVAHAIAAGLRSADPALEIDPCPMADGGEGTVATLVAATAGRIERRTVTGPLPGTTVEADFGILGDHKTAVVEMASASGLALLRPEQRNPLRTTTYGTGELLAAAAKLGVEKIILGIGGSATNDAGVGCAQACGAVFTLNDGARRTMHDPPLTGAEVERITRGTGCQPVSSFPRIEVACDVTNPLFGPAGAARIFSPQKGATPEQVDHLDRALHRLSTLFPHTDPATPGAGAAGGLGFGMLAFFGATLRPGFQIVAEAARLPARLSGAALCITGEGRLDAQSLAGKTAIGVARLCKAAGVPCVALAGSIGDGVEPALAQGLTAWFSICDRPISIEAAMQNAPRLLTTAAANVWRTARAIDRS